MSLGLFITKLETSLTASLILVMMRRQLVSCLSGGLVLKTSWVSRSKQTATLCINHLDLRLEERAQVSVFLSLLSQAALKPSKLPARDLHYSALPSCSWTGRGHREVPGRSTRSKNFKTQFFWRYLKFLPWGYSNRSRTSPIFFFLRYLNNYSR